jgi:hypothetical protein
MTSLLNRAVDGGSFGLAKAVLRRRLAYGRGDTALLLVGTQRGLLRDDAAVVRIAAGRCRPDR